MLPKPVLSKTALLTEITTDLVDGVQTCNIKLSYDGAIYSASDFVEKHAKANSKTKRRSLFIKWKSQLCNLPLASVPSWASEVATIIQLKIMNRRTSAMVLAMDKSENRYVLWSDGDSRGYTSEEWQQNMQFRINEITTNKVTLKEVVSQQWNVKDPTDLLRQETTSTIAIISDKTNCHYRRYQLHQNNNNNNNNPPGFREAYAS